MTEYETTDDPAALQRLPEDDPQQDALDPTCITTGITLVATGWPVAGGRDDSSSSAPPSSAPPSSAPPSSATSSSGPSSSDASEEDTARTR
jgi:hypothetical protein